MHTRKETTNAQWTVGRSHAPASNGHSYVLREVATGKTKIVTSSVRSSEVMEKLAKDKIVMLRRLADR